MNTRNTKYINITRYVGYGKDFEISFELQRGSIIAIVLVTFQTNAKPDRKSIEIVKTIINCTNKPKSVFIILLFILCWII